MTPATRWLLGIGVATLAPLAALAQASAPAASSPPVVAPAAPTVAAPAKPDLAKGAALSAVCAACHTADGSRGIPANPIIAGQHPDYLVKQLAEFKAGKRQNAVMQAMASTLSDSDMKSVAAFYAGKAAKPGFARNKELVSLGERVWRGGIADRGIPACAGCHGPTGAGMPVQYPRLGGQHADYVESQLVAFRGGARRNNAAMTGIAAKLNDREIKALADYSAGLR